MNIHELRLQHKTSVVKHAFRIYGVTENQIQNQNAWVDCLLADGDLQTMLAALKKGKQSPIDEQLTEALSKITPRARRIYADLVFALKKRQRSTA